MILIFLLSRPRSSRSTEHINLIVGYLCCARRGLSTSYATCCTTCRKLEIKCLKDTFKDPFGMRSQDITMTNKREKRKRKRWIDEAENPVQTQIQHGDFTDESSSNSESSSLHSTEELIQLLPSSPGSVLNGVEDEGKLRVIAIDCEMVGVGEDKKSALARCSIVNHDGRVLYDKFVKPDEIITDFRTQWSGIRPRDMTGAISFRKARRQARRLVRNHILVGHSLQLDLNVLQLRHPLQLSRDTARFVPLRVLAGLSSQATPSLKRLTRVLLHIDIQSSEHCSIEDARSAMLLYKLCENEWENKVKGSEDGSYMCDAYWPSWTKMN